MPALGGEHHAVARTRPAQPPAEDQLAGVIITSAKKDFVAGGDIDMLYAMEAPQQAFDMVEAMTRRALPGEGVLELDRFVAALRDRGWDGVVSAQVLSDDLRQLPIDEYATRVHEATARYWL